MFRLKGWRWVGAAMLLLVGLSLPADAQRAAAGPPDWPCVQRLIPELAWGTIWTGPSIEELEQKWWEDEEIGRVVRFATGRATREEDAVARVRDLVEKIDDDRERRLTLLFSGLFELISRERSRTIDSIRRYARGQVGRLARIGKLVDELEELRRTDGVSRDTLARLEDELFWERRVFQDRQASLRALCDQPYLLEERLSRLVRVIQGAMS